MHVKAGDDAQGERVPEFYPQLSEEYAMYNQTSGLLRVAFVVWCPLLQQAFHSHMELSRAYLNTFISRQLKQLIAQGEGVARAYACKLVHQQQLKF